MTYLQQIRRIYPKAIRAEDAVEGFLTLAGSKLGLAHRKIMFADSICADGLNSIEYPANARQMLGPFKLGGLNGFPFAGLTGMGAFAKHVPANGALFVFYAPHIGITADGTEGQVCRPGQKKNSNCCGAAQAALDHLIHGKIVPGEYNALDYQMNTIEQIFLAQAARILKAKRPIVEATQVMYEAIGERIDLLTTRTKYECRFKIFMGGILINTDPQLGAYVQVQRLECLDKTSGERQDWLADLEASAGRGM
jgi:hypothetical protein